MYTNTNGTPVLFGGKSFGEGDLLDFGDGSSRVLVPEIGPSNTPSGSGYSSTYVIVDAARGIAKATFTIDHTYSGAGTYVVSYQEPNRNAGVLNFDRSVDSFFYLESSFQLNALTEKAYKSPVFFDRASIQSFNRKCSILFYGGHGQQ